MFRFGTLSECAPVMRLHRDRSPESPCSALPPRCRVEEQTESEVKAGDHRNGKMPGSKQPLSIVPGSTPINSKELSFIGIDACQISLAFAEKYGVPRPSLLFREFAVSILSFQIQVGWCICKTQEKVKGVLGETMGRRKTSVRLTAVHPTVQSRSFPSEPPPRPPASLPPMV